MKIRPEMMMRYARLVKPSLDDLIVGDIRFRWREQFEAIGEESVRRFVAAAVERALAHGIEAPEHVHVCTAYVWAYKTVFGVELEDEPLRSIVKNKFLGSAGKVKAMYQELVVLYERREAERYQESA